MGLKDSCCLTEHVFPKIQICNLYNTPSKLIYSPRLCSQLFFYFLKIYLLFIVLFIHLSIWLIDICGLLCAWCQQRPGVSMRYPRNKQSYKQLWATLWVLELNPDPPSRATSALTYLPASVISSFSLRHVENKHSQK